MHAPSASNQPPHQASAPSALPPHSQTYRVVLRLDIGAGRHQHLHRRAVAFPGGSPVQRGPSVLKRRRGVSGRTQRQPRRHASSSTCITVPMSPSLSAFAPLVSPPPLAAPLAAPARSQPRLSFLLSLSPSLSLVCVCRRVCVLVHSDTHAHILIHTHTHAHITHVGRYERIHISAYIHIYIYVYTYIMHIHVCIHT